MLIDPFHQDKPILNDPLQIPRTKTLVSFLERLHIDKNSETRQAIALSKRVGRSIKAARAPRLLSTEPGQQIPPKETADKLLEAYFRTFEGVYRIIHIPSFRQEYERYWQSPTKAREVFIIQLQLCMALGTLVQDDKYSMRNLAAQWIYEARVWLLQASEKSQIDLSGLQIMCLVHIARSACGVVADLVWASAGTLMRMALYTGLHRDPDHLPKMSLFTAETRRRLWATILEILVLSSMESGGPPLITTQDFDTKPPGNFDDEDLLNDNPSTPAPTPLPMTKFTDTSIQIALLSSIRIRLQVSSYLNEFRSEPTYEKTLELNSDLTSASRSFDAFLRMYQSQQPSLSNFQIPLTEHTIHHYFLALHLPWLGFSKDDPRYYFSRKLCIDVAVRNQKEARAHGFLGADSETEPDDFGRLLICASSGFRYIGTQCLLVLISVLIWELEEQRTALRSLDATGSGLYLHTAMPKAVSTPGMGFGLSSSQTSQFDEVFEIIRCASAWTRARIKAGETNLKGYLFGAVMLAEAEGLLKGLSDAEITTLVPRTASEAVRECLEILQGLHAANTGDDDDSALMSGMASVADSGATAVDGSRTSGVEDLESMNIGSSSTINDWAWDAVSGLVQEHSTHPPLCADFANTTQLDDPNFNFNLNFGAMDVLFGNEGI